MRLLNHFFAAAVTSLVLADSVLTSASPACQKEIYIYFDVSGSMYETLDGITAQELFTGTIAYLLRGESFVDPEDRIVIVVFAESAATLFEGRDASEAARAVESIRGGPPPSERAVGSTASTNMVAVLNDLLGRIDPMRKQIFIIASDFAHHPKKIECGATDARTLNFRTAAQHARESLDGEPIKLALLTGDVVGDSCGGANQSVSRAVKGAFHQILRASGEVAITPARNVIANQLRRVIADPITLTKETVSPDASRVAIRVGNPNPFPVSITNVTLATPDRKTAEQIPQGKTIGCRSADVITVDVPLSLQGALKLVASVDANTPPGPTLVLPSEFVVITAPQVHIFKNFGRDTYAIELDVEKTSDGFATLMVSGVPGTAAQQYEIDVRNGPAHVALTLPGGDGKATAGIRVTADRDLYVKRGEVISEEKETHGERPEHSGGEHVPSYVRWMSVATTAGMLLSLILRIPGGTHKWWERFHLAHGIHIFHGALDAAVTAMGFTSASFAMFWPYGRILPTTVRVENMLWAAAAGGMMLVIYRWVAIHGLWRLFERRLLDHKWAIALRTFMAIVGILVALAAAGYSYYSLETALGGSILVHPASHP